ncbi:hypothetical protein [Flavobacterium album]|uniref:hypothetical protein n=1 Tax=Flavobacterium album TaxID=2175091 RepID=UPI0015E7E698|nr:hypothetical protein [Flavobacterium album]
MQNRVIKLSLFAMLLSLVTGCEVVGDIFKAGMWVGVIVVIAVIGLIIWLISRFRK